jgi:antitoxin VapB
VSLNIKNEETHELARELAERTGESLTEAVTVALRERLARIKPTEEQIRAKSEMLLAIGRDVAARLGPEFQALDPDKLLYDDELGLPK